MGRSAEYHGDCRDRFFEMASAGRRLESTMGVEQLGQLIDAHGAALTLFARQWCAAPEDVVQEAFIKLAQQQTWPGAVAAWLFRTVRNGAISRGRSERRRKNHERHAAQHTLWFQDISPPTFIDGHDATSALQELPIEEREIIIAHIWGGLTFNQIAEMNATSAATVWRRYATGLEALRLRVGLICPKTT